MTHILDLVLWREFFREFLSNDRLEHADRVELWITVLHMLALAKSRLRSNELFFFLLRLLYLLLSLNHAEFKCRNFWH